MLVYHCSNCGWSGDDPLSPDPDSIREMLDDGDIGEDDYLNMINDDSLGCPDCMSVLPS